MESSIVLVPCVCLEEGEAWLLSVVDDKLQAVKIVGIINEEG